MFDSVTSALIAAAPRLSRVDPKRLADQITDAYVQVAVAKSLLLSEVAPTDRLFDELRSIGAAQEAIALASSNSYTQRTAAYVAASAYQVLSQAFPEAMRRQHLLDSTSISAEVASTLLFLAADAAADASEVASAIQVNDDDPRASLLQLIRHLGRGEVHLSHTRATIVVDPAEDPSTLGASVGYWKCEQSLLTLFAVLDSSATEGGARETFKNIAESMEAEVAFRAADDRRTTTNRIAGPWHLARLLEMAEPALLQSATASIESPSDVDEASWAEHLARTVRRRPLLWRNHRSALDEGLLEQGVSAVLAFPTGAGKSTLSELKVIATVLRGQNVICLAPTLSLVDQLARSFRQAAPVATVIAQRDADEDVIGRGAETGTPEIYVMTPESCLAALGLDYERFGDVGLVMFDEAHLMHSEGPEPTRRSVDAALCFLTLASRFTSADLLLVSAMIANAQELTQWLGSITGRKAIALDSPWKPTRQARGALVYNADDIAELRARLNQDFNSSVSQGAPVATQAEMRARPYGFFSLRSTWESRSTRDYRLLALMRESVPLGVGGKRSANNAWWLTPNANKVAARLASAAGQSGMKTLVFTHQVGWSVSTAKDIGPESTRHTSLTPTENDLVARIVDALGSASGMYLEIDELGVKGDAIPHHGLLLPEERRLHERLYQRPDGVPVMVATSTVTQGMNFPSEFVIITSDRRFDPSTNSRARVESHELLNAAGRAGRAGSHSNALVLVIPGEIVDYDGGAQIGAAWEPLRDAFSKSDQCLDLEDPFLPLLGALDDSTRPPLVDYLARRLDGGADATVGPSLLQRSFSAHAARGSQLEAWFDQRLEQLADIASAEQAEPWTRQCAMISGLPLPDIQFVAAALDDASPEIGTTESWSQWVLNLLEERPAMAEVTLRAGSRAALAGTPEDLDSWSAASNTLVEHLRAILPLWLRGETLTAIQQVGIERGLARESDSKLTFARKFALRVIPDLAYLFSLPGLIQTQRALLTDADPLPDEHPLVTVGRCVELGVDSASKVALMETSPRVSRRDLRSDI